MMPAFESFQVGKLVLEVMKAVHPPPPHFYVYNLYIQLYNYIYNLYSTSMSWTSSSKGGGKSQLYEQILVPGRSDPTFLAMLNLAAEAVEEKDCSSHP